MPQSKISILSTRPVDQQLIKSAAKHNIQIDVIPFIETVAIDSLQVFDEIQNVLMQEATVVFTSMNAVDAVANHLHDYKPEWRIYCVGNATQNLVTEYFGKDLIVGTGKDANELAEKIIDDNLADEVIFFCGDKRRDELPELLRQNDIEVNEIQVYETKLIPNKITKNYYGVLFFSPSAVNSFFSINTLNEQTVLFAIGNTTANEIRRYSKNKIMISDTSGKKDLVEKAIEYFSS